MNRISTSIWKQIKKSQNVLLHLHPSPDGDSAGSALAFMHVLKSMGKNVTLIGGDSDYPKYLKTLPGCDQVVPKNYFQIDLNNFDLFIILDSAALNQISKMGNVEFPANLMTINIDHHTTNEKYADLNLVEPESPATCQVLYEFFARHKVKISPDAAACLFVGIYTDTGGFKYAGTDWKTLEIASKLAKINPNYNQIIFELENNDDPDRLKFLSLLLGNIETFFSNSVAIASITHETIKKTNLNSQVLNSSEVANMLKSVTDWYIGISFLEVQPKMVKLSFRTRNAEIYDVGKIAAAIGGGGHKAAAGATLNMSFDEAKKFLLSTIQELHPELGKP